MQTISFARPGVKLKNASQSGSKKKFIVYETPFENVKEVPIIFCRARTDDDLLTWRYFFLTNKGKYILL